MKSIERVVTKRRLEDSDEPWRYWVTRPVAERIEAVEKLRREHHGWSHGTEPRLPRVLAIVRRPWRRFLIVSGLPVPFISVDDLRTNKLATGRLRDKADAAELPPANGGGG